MSTETQWLVLYRQAYNPLHLIRMFAAKIPQRKEVIQRLFVCFRLESARKIKFEKEDAFIRETLSKPALLSVNEATLKRLLEQRRRYLVEIIWECNRQDIPHCLQKELKNLDALISRSCKSCLYTQQTTQTELDSATKQGKNEELRSNEQNRPKKKILQASPYLNLMARPNTGLSSHSDIRFFFSLHASRYGAKCRPNNQRRTLNTQCSNEKTTRKTTHNRSHLGRDSDGLISLLQQSDVFERIKQESTLFERAKPIPSSKKLQSRKDNNKTFMSTTSTSNSRFKKSHKSIRQQTEVKEPETIVLPEQNNTFVEHFSKKAEQQPLDKERPFEPDLKLAARGYNIRTALNCSIGQPSCSKGESESDAESSESRESTNQDDAPVPQPAPSNSAKLHQLVRSSRNHQSKLKKLSKDESLELQLIQPPAPVKNSTFAKQKEQRDKITYMQQAPLVRLRPKVLYADRGWRKAAVNPQNDKPSALQLLFDKFVSFDEDKTLLSFKEVKGFLRQSLCQLKRLSPPKDLSELQKFDALLADPSEDEESLLPSLTVNDLVSLISELAELNSKVPLKRSHYPMFDSAYQYETEANKSADASNQRNLNSWAQLSKHRDAFREETAQLQRLVGIRDDLEQVNPTANTHMEVISRWLQRFERHIPAKKKV